MDNYSIKIILPDGTGTTQDNIGSWNWSDALQILVAWTNDMNYKEASIVNDTTGETLISLRTIK